MQEYIVYALVGICSILILFSFITDSLSKKRKFLLSLMTFAAMILLVSGQLANYYDGNTSLSGILIARISRFLKYGMNLVISYIYCQYLKDLLKIEGKVQRLPKSLKIADYILIAGTILLFIAQSTGLYYTYDNHNIYHRSSGYFISYILPSCAILVLLFTIIRYRKSIRKRLFILFILFTTAPMASSILHLFRHEISISNIFIVGMVVLLYCFSIFDANDLVKSAYEKEVELIKETTFALVEAIDAKDSYTNGHSKRVAEYSVMIGKKAGKSQEELEDIYLIALLHDVGKIGIPDAIINKKGKLTDEEYEIIKKHPAVGREILSKISISPELAIGASFHHERYDGKGYPFGLKGEEIPEIARIIAVADTYDAMASKRSYRDVLSKEKILSELKKSIGTQFDPKFAEIMIGFLDENII